MFKVTLLPTADTDVFMLLFILLLLFVPRLVSGKEKIFIIKITEQF